MFERQNLIIDNEIMNTINKTNILLVGVGGVGCSCLEALVRLGYSNITIIDNDTFEESNLNRQLYSNINNIGHIKVLEAQKRAESINPNILLKTYQIFLDESNIDKIDINKYDYIIDACDSVNTKLLLIKYSLKYNIPIISSMGTGNRIDPTKLTITNIWNTNNDPLAKKMRKLLKDNHIPNKIPVVSSTELPIKTNTTTIGSCYLVPNTAGILLASFILNNTLKK